MSINWEIILNSTLGAGFVAVVLNYVFNAKIEKLKYKQLVSSKLYDRRAKVVETLYQKLDTFHQTMKELISFLGYESDPPKEKQAKDAGNAGNAFVEYYEKHKIYFDEDLSKKIAKVEKSFREAYNSFGEYQS